MSESKNFAPYGDYELKEALKLSGLNVDLEYDTYRIGYNKFEKAFVLARSSETWTNAHFGFHVLSSELIPHPCFKKHYKTKSVPDTFFNAWVDYVEHFDAVEVCDEDEITAHYEIKRVVKYFKVDSLKKLILLNEIGFLDFNPTKDLKIKQDEFYSVIEGLTHQFFSEKKSEIQEMDIDYGGNFDSGWALGRLSKYSEPEYKTSESKIGPITGYISSQIPVTFREFKEACSSQSPN